MYMQNVYLFQPVQAVRLEHHKSNNASHWVWLPYATARLWAYSSKFDYIVNHFQLKKIFPIRKPIEEILKEIDNPHICGFSSYMWNFNYNIALAKKIKQLWPNCKIVFGGPEITADTREQYLDIIDTTIEGEGEVLFKQYLEDYIAGETKSKYVKERIRDIVSLVSPYSTGIFDLILEENPSYKWGAIIETNRGCPYACTFCDWGGLINSKISLFDMNIIREDINWIKRNDSIHTIHIADANFGIFKERDLAIAEMLSTCNVLGGVSTSWSKVYNEYLPKIHEILGGEENNYTQIALQTGNDDTLKAIKRKNLSSSEINKLLQNNKEKRIATNHEYILGLPLETKQSWYTSLTNFLENGYHKMSLVYFCTMLPNTEMASVEYREKYKIKTAKTSVSESILVNADGILEFSEIVKSTSTMTYEELVDCYLFNIILTNTYNTGYNRLAFLIANKNFNISGLDFYVKLEEFLYRDSTFSAHLLTLKNIINEMFETGTITDPLYYQGARLDHLSYTFFHKNKEKLLNITLQVFKDLTTCDDDYLLKVKLAQEIYLFDVRQPAEQEITLDFNINTLLPQRRTYKVKHKISKKQLLTNFTEVGLHQLHVNQLLINEFTELSTFIPIVSV